MLYNGIEFYKRKEIKDILSYMRMVVYCDNLSFLRVVNEPKRNIGEKRIAFLSKYAEENNCSLYRALLENVNQDLFKRTEAQKFIELIEKYNKKYKEMKISELLQALLNDSGYEGLLRTISEDERIDNLSELKQSIFEYENSAGEDISIEEYLEKVALFTNLDKSERKNSVKMMTVHTAKGLEFPYVFVCSLNEGIFPTSKVNSEDRLEEERRLAYVAFTRAENALFLSDAEGINYDYSYRYPSRFIFNVDKIYLNYTVELEENFIIEANKEIEKKEKTYIDLEKVKFKIGDIVEHRAFGKGIIKEIDMNIGSYIVKFEKIDTDRNINFNTPLELCK